MINDDNALNALSDALLSLLERDTRPPCDHRWVSDNRAEREAVAPLCDTCPIKPDCANVAQSITPTHGIWAGHDWTPDLRKEPT